MHYIFSAIVVVVYCVLLRVCFRPTALASITPSTFLAAAIALQCSPLYVFYTNKGAIVSEQFSVPSYLISILFCMGYYMAPILYFSFIRPRNYFPAMGAGIRVNKGRLLQLFVIVFGIGFCILYTLLTPRYPMFKAVINSFNELGSSEINYLRRNEFAGGFFYQKVFTWLRFSISPLISIYVFSWFLGRSFIFVIPGFLLSYALYFCMSASFHKSTWLLGVIILMCYYFLNRNGLNLSGSKFKKSMAYALGIMISAVFLLTAAYSIQYKDNYTLGFIYHLTESFGRIFNAVAWGMAAFVDVFPKYCGYLKEEVLLAPLLDYARGPESIVGHALGQETTIQSGVLANLYAGIGWFSIPVYLIFTLSVSYFCDKLVSLIKSDRERVIATVLLGFSLAWNVQMPLYPFLFSSGMFLNSLFVIIVIFVLSQSSPAVGRMR